MVFLAAISIFIVTFTHENDGIEGSQDKGCVQAVPGYRHSLSRSGLLPHRCCRGALRGSRYVSVPQCNGACRRARAFHSQEAGPLSIIRHPLPQASVISPPCGDHGGGCRRHALQEEPCRLGGFRQVEEEASLQQETQRDARFLQGQHVHTGRGEWSLQCKT